MVHLPPVFHETMKDESPFPERTAPEGLCEIGRYARVAEANEHGLVILAMGRAYWLMPAEDGGYAIYVEDRHAQAVRSECARYDREKEGWPPPDEPPPNAPVSAASYFVYALLLSAGFAFAGEEALRAGGASGEAIFRGEFWRVVTALTLHADAAHLLGNIFAGILFASQLFPCTGPGAGWLLILASGAAGNLLSAAGRSGDPAISIGASTAVFGALGLLVGIRLIHQFRLHRFRWPRRLWMPLAAGAALLALMGTGGARTDLTAHFFGFASGCVLGAATAGFGLDEKAAAKPPFVFWLPALGLIAAAWWAAWALR
jgi:rhomboid protease GluP